MSDGLVAALARAQMAFPPIVKSHSNPAFKGSQYADVADVLAAVRPVLAAEGIVVTQVTSVDGETGAVMLYTKLLLGDEQLMSVFPLHVSGLTDQQVGSKLTYTKRYQLCALLGVHPVGDDDDGNLAATAPTRYAERPTTGRAVQGGGVTDEAAQAPPASVSESVALAAANPPEKPLAAMTAGEMARYGESIGIRVSGNKAEILRMLEPIVLAASGAEPWPVEGEGVASQGRGATPHTPGATGDLAAAETSAPSHPEPFVPPEKPLAAMTAGEMARYGESIGVRVSGSKADILRQLEPIVLAASGEEPFEVSPTAATNDSPGTTYSDVTTDARPEFNPVVASAADDSGTARRQRNAIAKETT